jgi:methylenetetrahydrofolate--tRNA-(uracil-5-)-methyltransferase
MGNPDVVVIGAGLAGAEAAWQAAESGVRVLLLEMRPLVMTPAHRTAEMAELICSNSLKALPVDTASGLLKEEMRRLGSIVIKAADANRVPAGQALAVERHGFSSAITQALEGHRNIELVRREVSKLSWEVPTVIATGPLTSEAMSETIKELFQQEYLYFYDAISPIVDAESIDYRIAFFASRYGKGGPDYLNCPMNREQYYRFQRELAAARCVPIRSFEKEVYFQGCMPIEEQARLGPDAMAFGSLKPVGLENPETGECYHAVVQLRGENRARTMYSMVGFQTRLTYPEQERVFRMIPGLEKAVFLRKGNMHRNTFINSPRLLLPTLQTREKEHLLFAGQITGVEGYVESAATGLVAGINAARLCRGLEPSAPPPTTAHGGLLGYISSTDTRDFQPMNVNFGLLPPLRSKIRDKQRRRRAMAERALTDLENWASSEIVCAGP